MYELASSNYVIGVISIKCQPMPWLGCLPGPGRQDRACRESKEHRRSMLPCRKTAPTVAVSSTVVRLSPLTSLPHQAFCYLIVIIIITDKSWSLFTPQIFPCLFSKSSKSSMPLPPCSIYCIFIFYPLKQISQNKQSMENIEYCIAMLYSSIA